jgi:hypothetical protein
MTDVVRVEETETVTVDGEQITVVSVGIQGPAGAGGGGGGAPTDATYLVGTGHIDLSAEIVVGATPGGELGGTWDSPTVDAVHSGSSHAATQAAAEATAQAALDAHLADTTDAHDASAISILDTAADFTATDVEGALAELQADHEADEAALAAHLADTVDAHDASAISSVPAGTLAATDVQTALNELDTEKAAAAAAVMDGDAAGGDLTGTYPSPTIAANAVTFAKMADIATDRLVGRDTAGTGDPETLTVSGGIEFTGTGGIQTAAFTGDVTKAAGGTAQTIADDAVTYAKIQNVTATDRILGRDTAGAGNVEELTLDDSLEFTGTGGVQRAALTGDTTAAAGSNATTVERIRGNTVDAGTFASTDVDRGYVWDGDSFAKAGISRRLFVDAGIASYNNDAAEKSYLSATFDIPANSLRVGDIIEIEHVGTVVNDTGATKTIRIEVDLDANVMFDLTSGAMTANAFGRYYDFRCLLVVVTIGGTGTIKPMWGELRVSNVLGIGDSAFDTYLADVAVVTCDTTQALTLDLRGALSAASTSLTADPSYTIVRKDAA